MCQNLYTCQQKTTKEQTCKQQHQTNPQKSYVKLDYCHKKYTFTSFFVFSCILIPSDDKANKRDYILHIIINSPTNKIM